MSGLAAFSILLALKMNLLLLIFLYMHLLSALVVKKHKSFLTVSLNLFFCVSSIKKKRHSMLKMFSDTLSPDRCTGKPFLKPMRGTREIRESFLWVN